MQMNEHGVFIEGFEKIEYAGHGWTAAIHVGISGAGWVFSTTGWSRAFAWNNPLTSNSLPYRSKETAVRAGKWELYARLIRNEKTPESMRTEMLDKIGDPAQEELFTY